VSDTDAHVAKPDPETHILFVHVNTKVEICLVTEKMKSKKWGCFSICWLVVCPKESLSSFIVSDWSCKICT